MSKINFMKTMRVPTSSFNKDNKLGKNNKDASWNNRFHLDKIPTYNAYHDQNSKIYQIKLRSILKSLNSKPYKKSVSPVKGSATNYEDLLKMDNRAITNKFYKEMNRDIEKEISEKMNEPLSEEMSIIQSMWDDLGVLDSFRIIFRYVCLELDQTTKKNFMEFELNSLRKLYDYFSKLTKEMQGRERVISLLRQYNNFLENDNISPKLTSDITQTFKNLRILSINIVHIFLQIRELSSYSILCGKFDFDKISKNFNYDRNYLIKMRTDTDFLKQSNLSKYFSIANNISDPFLVSLSSEQPGSNKVTVPLTEEMHNSIRKCQLIILQDQLYYDMNLALLNQQNNLDFSERSALGYNKIQNLKENPQRRHNDKKVQSATNPILERQHDEFTIKSKIETVKNDNLNINNSTNNIKVQRRINSSKKQSVEDGNDKSLNDSKLKKTPSHKIEKLDIKIKEKLDVDAKENRDKEIFNIIDIEENLTEKLVETKENVEVREEKIDNKEISRRISISKKESLKKIDNNNPNNFEFSSKKLDSVRTSQKSIQKVDKATLKESSKKIDQLNESKLRKESEDIRKSIRNTEKEISKILVEDEKTMKKKEFSVTDIKELNQNKIGNSKVEIIEDKIDDVIEEDSKQIKTDEQIGSENKNKNVEANKLQDSNMNEVIDENSIVENNIIEENNNQILGNKRESITNKLDKKQKDESPIVIMTKEKEKDDLDMNDIEDELSFQSEKDNKEEKSHKKNSLKCIQESSFRESKKIEISLEKNDQTNTNELEKLNEVIDNKPDKQNTEEVTKELENAIHLTNKEKSDSKLSKVMKTEESNINKSQRDKLSDSKLKIINDNLVINENVNENVELINNLKPDDKTEENKRDSENNLVVNNENTNRSERSDSQNLVEKNTIKTKENNIENIIKEDNVKISSKHQSEEKMIEINQNNNNKSEGKLASSKKSLKEINLSKHKSKDNLNQELKENLDDSKKNILNEDNKKSVKESSKNIENITASYPITEEKKIDEKRIYHEEENINNVNNDKVEENINGKKEDEKFENANNQEQNNIVENNNQETVIGHLVEEKIEITSEKTEDKGKENIIKINPEDVQLSKQMIEENNFQEPNIEKNEVNVIKVNNEIIEKTDSKNEEIKIIETDNNKIIKEEETVEARKEDEKVVDIDPKNNIIIIESKIQEVEISKDNQLEENKVEELKPSEDSQKVAKDNIDENLVEKKELVTNDNKTIENINNEVQIKKEEISVPQNEVNKIIEERNDIGEINKEQEKTLEKNLINEIQQDTNNIQNKNEIIDIIENKNDEEKINAKEDIIKKEDNVLEFNPEMIKIKEEATLNEVEEKPVEVIKEQIKTLDDEKESKINLAINNDQLEKDNKNEASLKNEVKDEILNPKVEVEIINEKNNNEENICNQEQIIQEIKTEQPNDINIKNGMNENDLKVISPKNQKANEEVITSSQPKENILNSNIICENLSDLKINFFTSSIESLQSIYDTYYQTIPEDQLISFKIKKRLEEYLSGNNMKVITIHYKDNIAGLCILNFDSNTNNFVRLYLSHFSTIFYNFSDILVELKNFIFKEIMFSEIVVYLYYKKIDDKFEMITSIRNAFKDLLKFRWVKIENTCGERLLVMNLKNTDQSPNFKECPDFNLTLKYNLAYELLKDDGSKPTHSNTEERFLNPLPLIISFSNLGVDKGFDVDNQFLKNINNGSLHRHYPHFLKVQTEDKKTLTQSIKNYIESIDYSNYDDNAMITNTLVNLAVQFNSVISSSLEIEENRYHYQRMNLDKIDIYTNEELNLKFYNIPFTDDRHVLLIGEVSEEFLNSIQQNILTEFFILKSKLACSSKENLNIWIPCFELKSSKKYNKLHYLEDVKISHTGVNYSAVNFSELVDICMKPHSEINTNCKVNPDLNNDIIIKNNFIFAIINIDLATELNLAAIFVDYVKKDKWKKEI